MTVSFRLHGVLSLAFLLAATICGAPAVAGEPARIYAAASLTDAWTDVAREWRRRGGCEPVLVFGGSARLAQQIAAGAPADVYVSADPRWMNDLQARGRIEPGSRTDLLGNRLVLIAPRSRPFSVRMERGAAPADAFDGRLCLGEPDAVPVGAYAREALRSLGWWDGVAGRVAGADDARAVVAFVARGECGAGVVYATDARATDRVVVVGSFPADSHRPVVYAFGLVAGARPEARRLMQALRSDPALGAIFVRHGFSLLSSVPPGT